MKSFLDGFLASQIERGFRGRLLSGKILRQQGNNGVDEFGDPLPSSSVSFKFSGFSDTFSAFVRGQGGFTEGSSKIVVIAGSVRPKTAPRREDKLTLRGKTYNVIRVINADPAPATYELEALEIDGNE